MRVDQLLKKDEDVNWALGLVIDVASTWIGGSAAKQLAARAAKSALFSQVSDGLIQASVKAGFDHTKSGLKDAAKDAKNQDATAEKSAVVSYIKQLQSGCDVAFERFATTATSSANDAQLDVLWAGLDPQYHTVEIYKVELGKKLDRFKKSGAADIGTKRIAGVGFGPHIYENTRVVWVRGVGGKAKLYFHITQGIDIYPNADDGGELKPVPDEFVAAAVGRHEAQWGEVPTIDDSAAAVTAGFTRPIRRLQLGTKT